MTNLDVTTREHNLVLLPSREQEAGRLRFIKCPKDRDPVDDMVQKMHGVSFSDSFYSDADTPSASDAETESGDEEDPPSPRAAVFLYNPYDSDSYSQDVLRLFGGLVWGERGQQPRMSMCGLLLCFAVRHHEQSKFDLGDHPEHWDAWLDDYKEAAVTGQAIEAVLLDGFEEASRRSGRASGPKRHFRCIATIDAMVKDGIERDWDMELEVWTDSVLQGWLTNDEGSETFLDRANRFLTKLVFDGWPADGICGIRVLQTLPMSSYGAFMIMSHLAVDVLFALLEVEFRGCRAGAEGGVARPVGGFTTIVSSDRRVFSFRDGTFAKANARSVIVSGLRALAARQIEDVGPMWQLPTGGRHHDAGQVELGAECVAASSCKGSACSDPGADTGGQEDGGARHSAGESSAAFPEEPEEHRHMGVGHFVDKVDENLVCGICQNVMVKPHSCQNGHTFCLWCISRWLTGKSKTCPVDREATQLSQLVNFRPLQNMIEKLRVRCPTAVSQRAARGASRPCPWTGTLDARERHMLECHQVMMFWHHVSPHSFALEAPASVTEDEKLDPMRKAE
eukprot:3938910-Rhodomonas_salina.12